MLDESKLNLEVRRLLKRFGVAAQREIETAVREAIASRRLTGDETLDATVTLEVPGADLRFRVEDTLELS